MRRSKLRNDKGAWCPVCRTLALRQTSVRRDWKCRECGSRIPDQTLMRLIVERIEIIQLNFEEAEAEG